MKCQFRYTDHFSQCVRCGRRVNCSRGTFIIADCRPGLGDYVASALDAIGITKARVEAVVGGPCGCQDRQAALNAAGAKYLGLSPGSTAPENKG